MSFRERAQAMGLNISGAYKGLYSYSDIYSEVIYRQAQCGFVEEDPEPPHQTDGTIIPVIAVFSKRDGMTEYLYIGKVSEEYQFVGNQTLVNSIKQSIISGSLEVSHEYPNLTFDLSKFRNDILLSSTVEVREAGDVLPCIIVQNGYNGTKAASVSYGISFMHDTQRLIYGFKLGEMRMVHLASVDTTVRESVTAYVTSFRENITDVIRNSFNTRLTEEQMLGTLDVLESIGKRKADDVKAILQEMTVGNPAGSLPTSWQMFVSIIKYASMHPNINVRRMMENAAESVLVIPQRMLDTLKAIERY
jgi:hypothetical protein